MDGDIYSDRRSLQSDLADPATSIDLVLPRSNVGWRFHRTFDLLPKHATARCPDVRPQALSASHLLLGLKE